MAELIPFPDEQTGARTGAVATSITVDPKPEQQPKPITPNPFAAEDSDIPF